MIPYKYRLVILCFIAFVATMLVFNPVLKIAKSKNIVDCPDARKLQKVPIPVLGGIAVFFGISIALFFYKTMVVYTALFPVICGMVFMMYIGAMDDILSIPTKIRFACEILCSLLVAYGLKTYICDFHGLWGTDVIPAYVGIPLSVLTFVGIVNAINMIDGIDGLSSAFSIFALSCLGILCFIGRYYSFSVLSAVMVGALIPFFLHNVFGYESKMFIGDAGTMMVGTAIASMVFVILNGSFSIEKIYPSIDFNPAVFCLAVLAIPVGDTLRVMVMRVCHRKSPFKPDKTHLHHFFVGAGFSHIWTTIIEITMNVMVLGSFLLTWKLGATDDAQLYVVIAVTLLLDNGSVWLLSKAVRTDSVFSDGISVMAAKSHVERTGLWLKLQKLIDGKNASV